MLPQPRLYQTLNHLVHGECDRIQRDGVLSESRAGQCLELCDVDLFLGDPRQRHLHLHGRLSNPYATIAEVFWVLAGRSELDPYLRFFIPRAGDFSDDGLTWSNAYGPKIYRRNQLDNIVQSFIQDGLRTRRAVMTIWNPEDDTIDALNSRGIYKPKDVSCSQWLGFWIRDGQLNCKLQMRSNDLIWGLSHINVFEFTFLQELILHLVNKNLEEMSSGQSTPVDLGYYHHSTLNLHVYDKTIKQAEIITADVRNLRRVLPEPTWPMDFGNLATSDDVKNWFGTLYDYFCERIKGAPPRPLVLERMFVSYNMVMKGNLLYSYVQLIDAYISHKQDPCMLALVGSRIPMSESLRSSIDHYNQR